MEQIEDKKLEEKLSITAYQNHSGKASFIIRILYMTFLVFFIFKGMALPKLLILTIVFDVLQYYVASIVWCVNAWKHNNPERFINFRNPYWTNFPSNIFWELKIITLLIFIFTF